MQRWILSVALVCALLAGTQPARAQLLAWSSSGVNAATSYYYQSLNTFWPYWYGYYYPAYNTNVTDDGSGGMIVCWQQWSYSWYIYVQRISSSGAVLWTSSTGVAAYNYSNSSNYYCTIMGDGNGGAYVGYTTYNPNTGRTAPFVQYINSSGQPQWGSFGYALGSVSTNEFAWSGYPYLIMLDKDGAGGVVASYYLYSSSTNYGNLYAARFKYTGGGSPTYVWGPVTVFSHGPGEQMAYASTTNYNMYMNPSICSDGSGGAMLAWQTYSGGYKLRVAKVTSTGGVSTSNFPLSYQIGDYPYYSNGTPYSGPMRVFPDNSGGAIVVFPQYIYSYGRMPFYATRISWNGASLSQTWGPFQVARNSYYQQYQQAASDGNGGFYLSAYDGWSTGADYLRHYDASGSRTCDVSYMQYPWYPYTSVANDGGGNAIVTWNNQQQIYTQKFNPSGSKIWGASGVQVSSNSYSSWMWPEIASDGTGGALIAWNSYNGPSGYYQILTQRVMDTVSAAHAQAVGAFVNAGNARVGLTNGAIAANVIGIKNFAGSQPASQRAVQVTGSWSPDGNVTLTGVTLPATIAPVGASMMFSIRVTPPRNGPFSDSIYLLTNDPIRPRIGFAVIANGVYPHLTASDTCTMPKWRVGTTYQRTFAIRNTGTDSLDITNATITTGDSVSFSLVGNPVQTIQAGSVGYLTIAFRPTTADPKTSQLNIMSDDSQFVYFGNPKVVQITGKGIYPHLTAAASMQFPYTVVDVRTSTATWLVNNTGTDSLHISAAAFGGVNGGEFQMLTPLPVVIAAGASAPLAVKWSPRATLGPHSGTMTITADDSSNVLPNAGFVVALNGTAVDGAPDFVPSSPVIGGNLNVHVNTVDTLPWTMNNTSNATKKFLIYSMELQGDFANEFTLLNPPRLNDTIAIGGSQTLRFTFHPDRVGTMAADLHMMTNASPLPIDIAMIGNGVKGQFVASPLDFGAVATDTCSTMPFTVTNYGSDALTVSAFAFLGSNSSMYAVTSGSATGTIQVGGTNTFDVQFCPTQVGSSCVVARFITSDRDTVFVNVCGRGAPPSALTMSSAVSFGLVAIEQPLVRTLRVTNAGGVPAVITGLSFSGAAPIPFSTTVTLPITLAAGDSVGLPILFRATTGGPQAATLRIRTADGHSATVMVTAYATVDPYDYYPHGMFEGDTLAPGQSRDESIAIGNFTNGTLTVDSLWLSDRGADGYEILYPLSWPLVIGGPNAYDSVSVRFAPRRSGFFYAARLNIALGNGNTLQVPMSGVSSQPQAVPEIGTVPGTLFLAQNYPNPFSGTSAIAYVLPAHGVVTLTLTDVLGRPVRTLVHGTQETGMHVATIDATDLAAGVYTCTLRLNGTTQSRIVHVLR